jgi:hypothetical protein
MKKGFIPFFLFFLILTSIQVHGQSGLYMRTQMWGSSLDVSWLFFTTDKKLVRNPVFGVNPVQYAKEVAANPSNVATYSLAGNKMNLKWGDGKTQTVNVEFRNGVLSGFDGGICSPAKPFAFSFFPDLTYSGFATSGSVSRSVTLFLGKDGKFRDGRVGAISGSGNVSGAAASSGSDGGTYNIKGNTITFKYRSGKEWIVVAQPYDLGYNDIIINDQRFKQQ